MATKKTVVNSYSTPAGTVAVYSDGSETIANGNLTEVVSTQNGQQSQTLIFGTATKPNTVNNVIFTNDAGDAIDGTYSTGTNAFFGGGGNDIVYAGTGNTYLDGGNGSDFLFGGTLAGGNAANQEFVGGA